MDRKITLVNPYRSMYSEFLGDKIIPNVTRNILLDRKYVDSDTEMNEEINALMCKKSGFEEFYSGFACSKKSWQFCPYFKKSEKVMKYVKEYPEFKNSNICVDSFTGEGKVKGKGTKGKPSFFYGSLIIGFNGEELVDPVCAVEVFTPLKKGKKFFMSTFKSAIAKFDITKFDGNKIYINKCSKAVTGSAVMKQYTFKDGFKCVASTREEAIKIHKVTAKPSRQYASVPTSFIKKLIDLGFDDEDNDVELDREQNNFNYVQIFNSSRSNCIGIVQKNLGNKFILFHQDGDNKESTLKSFKTIDEVVRFLEKPGVMFALKEFVKG